MLRVVRSTDEAPSRREKRVLMLDQGYVPHRVVSWQRAVCLLYSGAAEVIETYDDVIRSPSVSMHLPCVIRLVKRARTKKQSIKFSRKNVLTRDGYTCQYCCKEFSPNELNYDHVLPRSRGGKTTWENVVASCYPCNAKKGNRTLDEAGMALRKAPRKPAWLPISNRVDTHVMPEQWRPYLAAA